MPPKGIPECYVTDRNTRTTLLAGTRICSVVQPINRSSKPETEMNARHRTESRAREVVVAAWQNYFDEPLPWDQTEVIIIHTVLDVIYEIRVP